MSQHAVHGAFCGVEVVATVLSFAEVGCCGLQTDQHINFGIVGEMGCCHVAVPSDHSMDCVYSCWLRWWLERWRRGSPELQELEENAKRGCIPYNLFGYGTEW